MSPFHPSSNYYAWPGASPKRPPSADEAVRAVNHYDNGVIRFDSTVAQILESLQAKGYLDEALVVITGDHGEMLGEQGYFSHQHGLSESVLDIPLVLMRFGYSGADFVSGPLSSQIDIAPTVIRDMDIPAPSTWKGQPLQLPWVPRDLLIQQAHNFGVYRVEGDGRIRKYYRDLDSGFEAVTDPISDPLGTKNLIGDTPEVLLNSWRIQSAAAMLNSNPRD